MCEEERERVDGVNRSLLCLEYDQSIYQTQSDS